MHSDHGRVGSEAGAESRSRNIAGEGQLWHVHEVPFAVTDRRTGTSLIFENDTVIRRVRNFPANWYSMGDEELYRLSLGA